MTAAKIEVFEYPSQRAKDCTITTGESCTIMGLKVEHEPSDSGAVTITTNRGTIFEVPMGSTQDLQFNEKKFTVRITHWNRPNDTKDFLFIPQ